MDTVKKNFAYQSVYQILTMILPLVTAPYIARVLGAESTGIYSYTYIIANYFVVFAMLGLEQYGNRSIARVRESREKTDKLFSELLTLHLIISAAVAGIYMIYAMYFTSKYRKIALLQGFYVFSAVFDVNWFFFGIEKFKLTVTRSIIIKVASAIAMFLFVRTSADLWVYTLIMSISAFGSQIILWKYLFQYVSIRKVILRESFFHLKPLLVLFAAVIAAHIYRMIDKVMLGWFHQMAELGQYEYADKIIRIPLGLITALGNVMLSRMSSLIAKNDTLQAGKMLDASGLFVIFLSFALAFGIAGIAPEFAIVFLGEEYAESAVLMMILAITIPMIGWNNFVRTQILIPAQQDNIYTIAVTTGAIVNFLLNIVLIYVYSAKGAAIATIFSYAVVMLIQMKPLLKMANMKGYFRYALFSCMEGAAMFVIVRLIGKSMGISIITVMCEIAVGAAVYLLLSFAYLYKFKREIFRNNKRQNGN